MKILLLALAAATSLIACFCAAHALLVADGTSFWIAARALGWSVVFLVGLLTWFHWTGLLDDLAIPLRCAAVLLVVLGASGATWNIHLALETGEFEAPALLTFLVVVVQGILTVFALWHEPRRAMQEDQQLR